MQDLGSNELSALLAEWVAIGDLETRFGISKSTGHRLVAEELVEARKIGARTVVNGQSRSARFSHHFSGRAKSGG
jgi:hypothetical protein